MKRQRRIPNRLTNQRKAGSRNRRLFVEQLETRSLLAADTSVPGWCPEEYSLQSIVLPQALATAEAEGEVVDFGNLTLVEVPSSYRSEKVSDGLSRVAYEYDLWSGAPDHGDFRPTDPLVRIDNGRVWLEAVTTRSADELAQQLRALGAEVVAVGSPAVSAWLPILRLRELGALPELTFAKVPIVAFADPHLTVAQAGPSESAEAEGEGEVIQLENLVLYEPPTSYRSDRVSDQLARLAYEYDQFSQSPFGTTFIPSDRRLMIGTGGVLIEAVARTSGEELQSELEGIDATIVGRYEKVISAVVPLGQVQRLRSLASLAFANAQAPFASTLATAGSTQAVSSEVGAMPLQILNLGVLQGLSLSPIPTNYRSARV